MLVANGDRRQRPLGEYTFVADDVDPPARQDLERDEPEDPVDRELEPGLLAPLAGKAILEELADFGSAAGKLPLTAVVAAQQASPFGVKAHAFDCYRAETIGASPTSEQARDPRGEQLVVAGEPAPSHVGASRDRRRRADSLAATELLAREIKLDSARKAVPIVNALRVAAATLDIGDQQLTTHEVLHDERGRRTLA